LLCFYVVVGGGGDGVTRPFPMDRGAEEPRPASRSTPKLTVGHIQDLDQKSKMEEVVPKMALRRSSNAGQCQRKWVRSCRWCPQAMKKNSPSGSHRWDSETLM